MAASGVGPGPTIRRTGPAGSDPSMTIERHIDPYGISLALLLPQQPYGTTAWGDPDAASAFVAAANDFFLESWVDFDPRYGLAVTVSPRRFGAERRDDAVDEINSSRASDARRRAGQ